MVSGLHNSWHYDPQNARLDFYFRGTRIGHINASGLTTVLALSSGTTTTVGTGLTVTTGNSVNSAGDARVTVGNVRLGAVSAFATTQPTSAIVFKVGTAPVGAIATSGGLFTDGTNVMKIIAAGTATNVET